MHRSLTRSAVLLLVACASGGGGRPGTDAGKPSDLDADLDTGLVLPELDAGPDSLDLDGGEPPDAAPVDLDGGATDSDGGSGDVDAGAPDRCAAVDCSPLDGHCSVGVCDPATGTCGAMPRPDGTSCSSGASECLAESCVAGACVASPRAACTPCSAGVCDGAGTCGASPTLVPVEDFEAGAFGAGWTAGGAVPFFVTSGERRSGSYAAQSGAIGHSQTSSLSTSVTLQTPAELSFWTRTSTEGCCDHLRVLVGGVQRGQWSGETAWTERRVALTPGTHTIEWRYVKDVSVNGGLDTVWVDDITLRAIAFDGGFESGVSAPFTTTTWTSVTAPRSGARAARAGTISHNGTSTMSASFTLGAAAEVSFWYRVSSEANYDFLRVYVDGALADSYSGEVGWTRWARTLPAGPHTLEWRYTKDGSVSVGSDTAWIDDVDLPWPTGLCP
ncbi:MAG: hypothetical protein KF901_24245 [Myxococcales bacterium]|nr:hypothetical protein [Myxococcales bacterium]